MCLIVQCIIPLWLMWIGNTLSCVISMHAANPLRTSLIWFICINVILNAKNWVDVKANVQSNKKQRQFELRQPYINCTHSQDIKKFSPYTVDNPTHSSRLGFLTVQPKQVGTFWYGKVLKEFSFLQMHNQKLNHIPPPFFFFNQVFFADGHTDLKHWMFKGVLKPF